MKRRVVSRSETAQLPNDETMKNIEDEEEYKYLGILYQKLVDFRTWKSWCRNEEKGEKRTFP